MPELLPDEVSARRFRLSLRGFDPDEVSAFLADVAATQRDLTEQRDRLAARLAELGGRDVQAEFAAVGREVGEVLEASRRAAESMRDRAATDAARWRAEAAADAEGERRQAGGDAEALRADAWTTSTEMLETVQREVAAMRAAAERDAITVRGSAEREAHRLTAAGRREAEDLLRGAKMESERLGLEATSRHDEVIESARRQAESAQERARALEQRRDELLGELENLRASLARMEGELDERRTALNMSMLAEPTDAGRGARVPLRGGEELGWEPGETIRVIPPKGPASAPPAPPDAMEMAAEVRRLRQTTAPAGPPPEQEPAVDAPSVPGSSDALGDLFQRLRSAGGKATPPPEGTAVETPGAADAAESPAVSPSRPKAEVSDAATRPDPFVLRDRLLLPITNRALRALKRQLTDEQNLALEELRLKESDWEPTPVEMADRLRADLTILAAESFAAGHAAAVELAGAEKPRPATPTRGVDGIAEGLGAALLGAHSDARQANHGVRQFSSTVSRIFRTWRTDEAERRVMDLALVSYHDGLAKTLSGAVGYVVSGRGCATCRGAAEEAGDALPPLHPGCGCTIAPI